MDTYPLEVERKMKRFFGWLSEKDRRRYAAVEAAKTIRQGPFRKVGTHRWILFQDLIAYKALEELANWQPGSGSKMGY